VNVATSPLDAVEAISNAVHALALAQSLGAPEEALDEALGRVSVVLGVPLAQRVKAPLAEPQTVVRPVEEELPETSAWDPDPIEAKIEATRCRALLLTVIQRAMHDWVMYRTHAKVSLRQLAEDAYIWLFEEKPGHPWWYRRKADGYTLTGFLAICEVMDVDPDFVRQRAKRLTPREIMTAGRPAERRRHPSEQASYVEHSSQVDIGSLESTNNDYNSFEAHFAVSQPGYM
jgi:hypothetical protein